MRVLSLDIGRNKTGVAIAEQMLGFVMPLSPILVPLNRSLDQWFETLLHILKQKSYDPEEIGILVVGSWEDADYSNLEMKKLVKKVVNFVRQKTNWKIELVRETCSSIESKFMLKSMGFKPKRLQRSLDSYAASLLLIDYLELIHPRKYKNNEGDS